MTRIAIFTTHPIQYQVPWFRALCADHRLHVEVVFSHLPDPQQQGVGFGVPFEWDVPLLTGYSYRILPAIRVKPAPPYFRRWVHGIGRALDEIRPDVALILGWQDVSLVQSLFACKARGVPIVMRGESNALRRRSVLVTMLHRRYFSLCDAFLAIGNANAKFYLKAGVQQNKIFLAGYAVDNDRFIRESEKAGPDRINLRRRWAIPDGAMCFAFVGKLEAKKCPLDFIEALRVARDLGAPVAGIIVGTGELLDAARDLVTRHALPVNFVGFLNQSEVSSAYVAADVLVLPSDYGETWGLVINEAMACGTTAIVSDRIGAANDLVIDEQTGRVVPHGDVAAIARAMVDLSQNPDHVREMGQAGRRHVRRGYSIAGAVEQTRAAVEFVLKGVER